MSQEKELMEALQRSNDSLDDFKKSHAAEVKVLKEGLETVKADWTQAKAQLQAIAEKQAEVSALPKTKKEMYAEFGKAIMKAQSEGTDTAGGYLVADEFSTMIKEAQNEYGAVRKIWGNQIIPMASDVMKIPVNVLESDSSQGPVVAAVSENAQITADDSALDQVTLTAAKYATLTHVSNELFDDAFVEVLGAWLLPNIARSAAKTLDDVVFNTASTGLLKSTSIQTVTMDGGDTAFSSVSFAYLRALQDAVVTDALAQGQYYAHRSVINLIRNIRADTGAGASTGVFLYGNPGAGVPNSVDNYPVEAVEKMPASSATAVSTSFILFGDLPMGMIIGERGQRKIAISDDFKFDYDQKSVRMTERWAYSTNANLGYAISRLKTAAA